MNAALLAGLAMFLQDVAGVLMMQYESNSLTLVRRRPFRKYWQDYVLGGWKSWAAAVLDEGAWIVGITTTTISVTAFAGHSLAAKAWVFLFVSTGNLLGSRTGQELGIWLLRKRGKTARLDGVAHMPDRLDRLEAWARTVGYSDREA